MAIVLLIYLLTLSAPGDGIISAASHWVAIPAQVLPLAICWWVAVRWRFRLPEIVLVTAAMSSFILGSFYNFLTVDLDGTLPQYAALSDLLYLSYAPLLLVALITSTRSYLPGLRRLFWLDSALGSLAAVAVLAVLLGPTVESATRNGWSIADVIRVSYPMVDLVVVAVVVGLIGVLGSELRRWGPLLAAIFFYAVSDVSFALRVTPEGYQIGTPWDALWALSPTLVAVWALGWRPAAHSVLDPTPPGLRQVPLMMPAVAMVASLGVLITASQLPVATLAVVAASLTMLLAVVRTHIAYRQLVRMADLRAQASTDELTGLPNRRAFTAEAVARLSELGREHQALMPLDLDKFKEVNDELGHQTGDRLLLEVGRRLRAGLRADDLLARLGGDEFAILLDDPDLTRAVPVAERLRQRLSEPFAFDGVPVRSTVSIGIAAFPEHGDELTTLLRRADKAMYRAKADHSGIHLHIGTDDDHDEVRLRTRRELYAAIVDGEELVLHFQPIMDLRTGEISGAEALVLWDHPTRGLQHPSEFLNLVEEHGLSNSLARVVIAKALDQAANLHRDGLGVPIAVNLSGAVLVDEEMPETITHMLAARGLPAQLLQLEITEAELVAKNARAHQALAQLRSSGIQIALDDFGTGKGSLVYLRELPVDELKLDPSFVQPITQDPRAAALVAAIIALAHSIGLRTVAEGVEDDVCHAELARQGCDHAQGHYICRPLPAAEFNQRIAARHRDERVTGPGRRDAPR